MAAINAYYDNFVLQNEVQDMYLSRLNLQQFCTVDTSLVNEPGDIVKVNVYSATDGAEDVALGEGNTKSIVVSKTDKAYTVKTAQNRFEWLDEEARRDPMVPYVGAQKAGIDLFNHEMADIYAEFKKATLKATLTDNDYFGAIVDAQAQLNIEATDQGAPDTFAFVSPADLAKIRKSLKDNLKYVESFVRTGYVGTVAGTPLFVKKDATAGTIVLATKEAVKLYVKKGVTTELIAEGQRDADDANIRKNTLFSRAVYLPVFYNATKAVLITAGA
jgi:hypothetical protein